MNEKEILARCEAVITEVDIQLMEWRDKIDLTLFAGQDVPLVLYTNDERLEIGTARLHHDDGALKMTGEITAELAFFNDQPGAYSLGFDIQTPGVDEIDPEPYQRKLKAIAYIPRSIPNHEYVAKAHFTMEADGTVWDNYTGEKIALSRAERLANHPPFEGLNKPLTIHGLEEAIYKEEQRREKRQSYLDDHPFFKNQEGN